MMAFWRDSESGEQIEIQVACDKQGNFFAYVGVKYFGTGKDLEPLLEQVSTTYSEEANDGANQEGVSSRP